MANTVNAAYIAANFRPAVLTDFAVGAGYWIVRKDGTDKYVLTGRVVGTELVRESTIWIERMRKNEIYIATTYAGTPIGGGIF
jgi:hypothetical protein